MPLVDVERARRAGQERVALGGLVELDRHPADLARGHALGAAVERLGDQLRAEADAEHRQAARVRVGDDLALALERRVAVRAVRVDDAAEHDQRRRTIPPAARAARARAR